MQCKVAYKKDHAQARIKPQANDGTAKFGAANSTARQDTTRPTVGNQLEVEDGSIKALEGYFNNLAAAAINKKSVLQQLALNNTTLVTSNESLVALVKMLVGTSKTSKETTRASRRAGKSAARAQPSATIARNNSTINRNHATILLKTRTITNPGWRSSL